MKQGFGVCLVGGGGGQKKIIIKKKKKWLAANEFLSRFFVLILHHNAPTRKPYELKNTARLSKVKSLRVTRGDV